MASITWNEKLSVHVSEMDKQHQKLIQLINELNEAMAQGKGKETVNRTVSGLLNYTKLHFGEEEKLFDRFSYPEKENQKKMHQKFIEKAMEFKKQSETGHLALSIPVMNFLSDWLKNHIQIEDKKYGPFFNQKGIK
jgi:hemerythrin